MKDMRQHPDQHGQQPGVLFDLHLFNVFHFPQTRFPRIRWLSQRGMALVLVLFYFTAIEVKALGSCTQRLLGPGSPIWRNILGPVGQTDTD